MHNITTTADTIAEHEHLRCELLEAFWVADPFGEDSEDAKALIDRAIFSENAALKEALLSAVPEMLAGIFRLPDDGEFLIERLSDDDLLDLINRTVAKPDGARDSRQVEVMKLTEPKSRS